jgi:hypothetical protein
MKPDVLVNILDTITFFLAAPEIIGKEALEGIHGWAVRYTFFAMLSQGALSPRIGSGASLSYPKPSAGDAFVFAIKNAITAMTAFGVLSVALEHTGQGATWLRILSVVGVLAGGFLGFFSLLIVLTSVFVGIVGNRNVSRALVGVGATLFVLTRLYAIWTAEHS